MKRIYISPSNQPSNLYAVGGTTEKIQMEALAKMVQDRLQPYEVETVMATLSYNITQRDDEAKTKGCNYYLALHSNAGGGGTSQGAVAFYHKGADLSKDLAIALVDELNAINPHPENRANQVVDGMTLFSGAGLGEIREPYKKSVSPVLLEVDFHDNPTTAKWIIDNKPAIADAVVRALVKVHGLKRKPEPVSEKPLPDGQMLRVVVGTYSLRSNAEAIQAKLKAAGFESFLALYKKK